MAEGEAARSLVRPLRETDLPEADRIMRAAFGTFLRLPDPMAFFGDGDYVFTRFAAEPSGAFAAEVDGALAGSCFATRWGTVGFFGPLTVRPDLWDRKIAQALLAPTLACFDAWGTTHAGLFTFAHSPKHLALYQKYDFWPVHLNPVLWKRVRRRAAPASSAYVASRYSELDEAARVQAIGACRSLADAIYEGLDLSAEIRAVHAGKLGDTLFVHDADGLAAFAVCHAGARTEAGSGALYVKFGAARAGARAARDFDAMLDACESHAAERALLRLVAGVSTARREAYAALLARGFRIDVAGVTMIRGADPGYRRAGVFVIDDWR
jgi:hypothetical protein